MLASRDPPSAPVRPHTHVNLGARSSLRLPAVGVLISLWLAPLGARAQSSSDLEQAKQWFKEAEALEKKGDCVGAIDKFEKALAVKATPQLHLRVGACQEKVGRLVEAIGSYKLALDKANSQSLAQVATVAKDQIAAITPRIPSISVAPAKPVDGFRAAIDGVVLEPAALGQKQPVNPGTHKVTAEAPGHPAFEQSFTLVEGEAKKLEIDMTTAAPPPPPDGDAARPAEAPLEPRSPIPAMVLVGGGVAAIAGGVVLFLVASGKDSDIDDRCGGADRLACPAAQKDEIESDVSSVKLFQGLSFGIGGAGVIAAGIGAFLLITAPTAPETANAESSRRSFEITPAFGGGQVGLSARGRF